MKRPLDQGLSRSLERATKSSEDLGSCRGKIMPSAVTLCNAEITATQFNADQLIASKRHSNRSGRIVNQKRRMMEQKSRPIEDGSRTNASGCEGAGWRCRTCGALITRIEDGWVEWLASEGEQGSTVVKGLRLVHRGSAESETPHRPECRYDCHHEFRNDKSIVEGLPLERFVGPDGLMLLLSFLAIGEMPKDDVLELAKRVQIPGYEQARGLFQAALDDGVVTPAIRERYYLQSELDALLRWSRFKVKTK